MYTALVRLGSRLQKGDFHHTLGRFHRFRVAYSQYVNVVQRIRAWRYASEPDRERLNLSETSLFHDISPTAIAQELQQEAVSFCLSLPHENVREIYRFACETPCWEPGFDGEFYAADVVEGHLNGARQSFRGLVKNPHNCPQIKSLTQDPTLLEIVRSYLKYWPNKMTCHLSWSFAVDLPESEQKKRYPPLNCHYDVAGYNFMTAYFYITDVDADHGAHVMIKKSHNHKPLSALFVPGAGTHLAKKVVDYYGTANKLVIEGKAGFGFVQDPSCFHWLLPPTEGRRLLLQIRYA